MRNIFLCVLLVIVTFSCETAEDSNPPEENFYALTVGNSWVYKNYRYLSSSDTYEETGIIDSVSIVSLETIGENEFFKFRRLTTGNDSNSQIFKENGEHFEFLRDSLGFLINEKGFVKYVNNDFSERLTKENDWGDIYEKLLEAQQEITLNSGVFNSYVMTRYAKRKENNDRLPSTDYIHYSDGFGLVYETISFISSEKPVTERRLDSYEVN